MMVKNSKLRAYIYTPDRDCEYCIAVIAYSTKQAKKLGYEYWAKEYGVEYETFIEQRVAWQKDANIIGITSPCVIDDIDGVRRNIYGYGEELICDKCKNTDRLYHHNGQAWCSYCIDEEKNENSDTRNY